MTEQLYPASYNNSLLTMAQYEGRKTVRLLHPEVWRRFRALMEAAADEGVPLGVGTGWRIQPVNPDGTAKPGFALPGNSNHEGFPADGVSGGAVAIDAIGNLTWMEEHLAAYGLRSFNRPSTWGYAGGDEAWHIQPVEIPASRSRRTTPWTLPTWNLPRPVVSPPRIVDAPSASPFPLRKGGPVDLSRTRWLQQIMNERWQAGLTVDGGFGSMTDAAVRRMQRALGVFVDGVYGNQSANALAAFLTAEGP